MTPLALMRNGNSRLLQDMHSLPFDLSLSKVDMALTLQSNKRLRIIGSGEKPGCASNLDSLLQTSLNEFIQIAIEYCLSIADFNIGP